MPKILIPTPLRQYAGGHNVIEVEAATVGEALDKLTAEHADLRRHLYNDEGKLRSFVNVYVDDEDIRYLDKDATKVSADGTISITGGADLKASAGPTGSAAGSVEITATGAIDIAGNGGSVEDPLDPGVVDPVLLDAAVSQITSSVGDGLAGSITVEGSSVELTNTVVSTETASTDALSTPASIDISALTGEVTLLNTAVIASTSGAANAGDIDINGATTSITGLGPEFDAGTGDQLREPRDRALHIGSVRACQPSLEPGWHPDRAPTGRGSSDSRRCPERDRSIRGQS